MRIISLNILFALSAAIPVVAIPAPLPGNPNVPAISPILQTNALPASSVINQNNISPMVGKVAPIGKAPPAPIFAPMLDEKAQMKRPRRKCHPKTGFMKTPFQGGGFPSTAAAASPILTPPSKQGIYPAPVSPIIVPIGKNAPPKMMPIGQKRPTFIQPIAKAPILSPAPPPVVPAPIFSPPPTMGRLSPSKDSIPVLKAPVVAAVVPVPKRLPIVGKTSPIIKQNDTPFGGIGFMTNKDRYEKKKQSEKMIGKDNESLAMKDKESQYAVYKKQGEQAKYYETTTTTIASTSTTTLMPTSTTTTKTSPTSTTATATTATTSSVPCSTTTATTRVIPTPTSTINAKYVVYTQATTTTKSSYIKATNMYIKNFY